MLRMVLPAFLPVFLLAQSSFRNGPAHTGVYETTTPPALATTLWKFKSGAAIVSSPAVSEGRVYFGSNDGYLYALDATSGAVIWKYRTRGAVSASPAVADGIVYVGSRDGFLHAVRASSGEIVWKFATAGERRFTAPGIHGIEPRTETMPDPYDVFLSSPAIALGRVYFGSGDHHVYALDAKTGQLAWKHKTGNVVHASPAVSDGMVFIGSWDRFFYALDAASGEVKWRLETGEDAELHNQTGIASSAAIADGKVFFGCRDGFLYAASTATGKLLWKHDNHKGWVIASPAAADGRVYFPTSDGQRFKALDASTGALVYDLPNKAISFSSPAVAGNRIYYGSSDGWLQAVDRQSGKLVARFETDGSKANAALYIDKEGQIDYRKLYSSMTLDAVMVGLDRMYSLGSVLSSPVIAEGIVYVGSTDGNLYALH